MLAFFLAGSGLWLGGIGFALLTFLLALPIDIYLLNRNSNKSKKAKEQEFQFYFKSYLLMLKLICLGGGVSAVQKKYWDVALDSKEIDSLSPEQLKQLRAQVLSYPLNKCSFTGLLCDLATREFNQEQISWLTGKFKDLLELEHGDNTEAFLCFEQFKTLFNVKEEVKVKEQVCLLDIYGILGSAQTASNEEVKKQFRKLSQLYHPDKLPSSLSEKEREEAHWRFLNIVEAYLAIRKERKF